MTLLSLSTSLSLSLSIYFYYMPSLCLSLSFICGNGFFLLLLGPFFLSCFLSLSLFNILKWILSSSTGLFFVLLFYFLFLFLSFPPSLLYMEMCPLIGAALGEYIFSSAWDLSQLCSFFLPALYMVLSSAWLSLSLLNMSYVFVPFFPLSICFFLSHVYKWESQGMWELGIRVSMQGNQPC